MGTFPQNSNANATSGSNYPEDLAGMLEVINDDFGNGLLTIQRYTMYNTSRVWSRRYYNGTWSTWVDMTLNSTYNLSGYLTNTTDTLTGILTIDGQALISNTFPTLDFVDTMNDTSSKSAKI